MAKGRKKRSKSSSKKSSAGSGHKPASKKAAEPTPRLFHREIRPYIYAGLCFVLAIIYLILFTTILPNRHTWAQLLLYSFAFAVAVMGSAMLVRRPKSWWVAVVAGGYMLVAWIVTLVLILMTASFLAGVYGAMGKAASTFALMAAVLSFQLVALLPMLQLKFLMTRAGRRWFKLEPLWG